MQTFSFVINKAIGHYSDFAANYLDDIIVFSRTAEDHMAHLERIFTALQMADLKIKVLKCEFFKKHVSYLAFLIGETGICCDRSKVEAINKIATPTSIEEVHQFNEMCSYYQKFILHYSDISKCFNDMTKKGATFNWTKECDTAFKLLKENSWKTRYSLALKWIKTMLSIVTLPSIVIQVFFNKLDPVQKS